MTDQTLKNQEGNIHLWYLHKRGVGTGVLKICQVFAESIILNNRSIANFCRLWKWEGHLLVISCGCHKWVTSKTIIISKKSLESKRVRNSRNFNLIIRHTVTYHFTLVINIKNSPPPLIWHLLLQRQQSNRQNNVWNMFKVNNNKDARTSSVTSS